MVYLGSRPPPQWWRESLGRVSLHRPAREEIAERGRVSRSHYEAAERRGASSISPEDAAPLFHELRADIHNVNILCKTVRRVKVEETRVS